MDSPLRGMFTHDIYTTFSLNRTPKRYNLTPNASALQLTEPTPDRNSKWMESILNQNQTQEWAQWNQDNAGFQAFQFEEPGRLQGTLLSPIEHPIRAQSLVNAKQYIKAVRKYNWKVGKEALFPKSKLRPPEMETMRIQQLNQRRETEQLRSELQKAQREQELAQEGTQDLQHFIDNLINEKDAIQEQTNMLKQELKQQQEEQSREQQTRKRQEQLTQNELYELR